MVNRLHHQKFSVNKINPVQCTASENTKSKSIFIDIVFLFSQSLPVTLEAILELNY